MILQILHATPPARSGLADYARKLQQHWPDPNERWAALALQVPSGAAAAWPNVVFIETEPNADSLVRALRETPATSMILHYVPHGYDPKGIPTWLIDGLEAWKRTTSASLFAVYHELYLWAKPWRRCSVYNLPSRACFRRLAPLVDGWVTSNEHYYALACAEGADPATGATIPIGSNIELLCPRSTTDPPSGLRLIVFGLAPIRARALRAHRGLLKCLASSGLVRSVHIVGSAPNDRERANALAAIPRSLLPSTSEQFDATEMEVSHALSEADVGLCATTPLLVNKSGVYAACCAHGVVPVVNGANTAGPHPPFVPNEDRRPTIAAHFLSNPERVSVMRREALEWSATVGSWDAIARSIHDRVTAARSLAEDRHANFGA